MKAIVAREPGPPEVLELREVDTPSPGPNEVLIKVAAAGVNRADLLQRQGHYQPLRGRQSRSLVSRFPERSPPWVRTLPTGQSRTLASHS